MSTLDGTKISKPIHLSLTPSPPRKTHRCCGRLFASPTKRESARDEVYNDSQEEIEEDTPMRLVTPRATAMVPVAATPKMKKRSMSLRRMSEDTKRGSRSTDGASMVTAYEEVRNNGSNVEVVGSDSVGSPARNAALTSHPVHGVDTEGKLG